MHEIARYKAAKAALTRLVALALCLLPILVFSPPSAVAATEPVQAARLSNREAIALVGGLMAADRLDEAAQICTLLLESNDVTIRVEAIFRLGNIFYMLTEYDKAIASYLTILNSYPELTRVRLELARTYFASEDYEKADFHFRLVQGDEGLPVEVGEKIDLFLSAIRRKKNWTISTDFGLVPDSNLNYASGNERECIRTPYGLLCRKLPAEESGVGARLALRGTHYQKLGKSVGIKSTASVSLLDFERSAYDDNSLYLASGPRVLFPAGEASLQPSYSMRWVAGKEYSRSLGARFDATFDPAEKWALDAGAACYKTEYADAMLDNLLRGETFQLYSGMRYIVNSRSLITAGLDYTNERTKAASFGSRAMGGSIGYYQEFPLAFTAYAELALRKTRYTAPSLFITSAATIEEKRRQDRLYNAHLRLSNRKWEGSGFTPTVSYTYTRRDSNIWNNDYDKHRIDFSLRLVF